MAWRMRRLAAVGTIVLVVGLSMALTGQPRFRTGLVLLAGCLFWIAFVVMNELSWDGREPPRDMGRHSRIPWGELWPFVAMLVIALVGLYVVPLLR